MGSDEDVRFRAVGEDLIVRKVGPLYAHHPMIVVALSDAWLDRDALEMAVVIAVGPDVREEVSVGVEVLVGRYGGDAEFTVDGVEYTRCAVADIVAVMPQGSEGVA